MKKRQITPIHMAIGCAFNGDAAGNRECNAHAVPLSRLVRNVRRTHKYVGITEFFFFFSSALYGSTLNL